VQEQRPVRKGRGETGEGRLVAGERGGAARRAALVPSLLLLLLAIVPGLLALLFWRKRVLVVTYSRAAPA
jgi:hypothetical protein